MDEGFTTASVTTGSTGSGSCNGNYNQYATISMCGCDDVTITGSFYDNSDGSSGQVTSASVSSSSMSLQWDDTTGSSDCDLDISGTTSWSASKSGTTLTVSVSHTITGYEAGNSIESGYSITDDGASRTSSGTISGTHTYTCDW